MDGTRGSTLYIADLGIRNLVMAEVGVRDGMNAVRMLEKLDIKRLFLVDPYTEYLDGNMQRDADEQWRYYKDMFENILPYKNTVLVNQTSLFAATLFPDRYFDVVYIDADHSYRAVMLDMDTWWEKVKMGGYLTGHDYTSGWTDDDGNILLEPGVIKAVTEFCKEKGLDPVLFSDTDWLIQKV